MLASRVAIVLLALPCGACAPPHGLDAHRLEERAAVDAAPSAAASAPPTPTSFAATAPASSAPDAGETLAAYEHPVDDVPAWLGDRNLKGKPAGDRCFALQAGVPLSPALLCRSRPRAGSGPIGPRDRTTERLYRSDGSTMVEVWAGTVAIYANWVDLIVDIQPDGARLVLRDRTRCACEDAEHEDRAKRMSNVQPESLTRELWTACGARGAYAWTGSRYERVAATVDHTCDSDRLDFGGDLDDARSGPELARPR